MTREHRRGCGEIVLNHQGLGQKAKNCGKREETTPPQLRHPPIRREKYEVVRDFVRACTASEFNPTAQKR